MATRYQLYYSIRSPFARRIRVAFQKLGIPFEAMEINVMTPPPELLALNPLVLVPTLVIHEGKETTVLSDSWAILEYLHEQYGNRIWPTDAKARLKVRAASVLAEGIMAETVKSYLESLRALPGQEELQESADNIDRTMAKIHSGSLKEMPWKVSDFQMTQAGYDLFIALEYLALRRKDYPWTSRYPELARFYELHRNRQDLVPTTPPA